MHNRTDDYNLDLSNNHELLEMDSAFALDTGFMSEHETIRTIQSGGIDSLFDEPELPTSYLDNWFIEKALQEMV